MPPGIAKKLKREEETRNAEPTSRRRTRSVSLDPPAVAQTVHSGPTTRSRARQDGATEISAGLQASAKRGPSWKRHPDNPTTRPEQEDSEATDDLSTLLEVDESGFSTQVNANYFLPPLHHNSIPILLNGIKRSDTGIDCVGDIKQNRT